MTEKEMEKMGIFVGADGVYIASTLKNGSPSKNRRKVEENELLNLMMWYVDRKCYEMKVTDFTINIKDKPVYRFEHLGLSEAAHQLTEDAEKEVG